MHLESPCRQIRWTFFAVLLGFFATVAQAEPSHALPNLIAANNNLAFHLLNQIVQSQPQANTFISPFSVSSALQMVANGAGGQTKIEIRQTLQTAALSDTD